MKRWIIVLSLLISNSSAAADIDSSLLADACLKSKDIEFCEILGIAKNNSEKLLSHKLTQWGLLNFSVILGSMLKVATENKIEFTDKTDHWLMPGQERKLRFTSQEVFLVFVWPLN